MYILTDLIVSSMTCKCVFYTPERNAKGAHGIVFWKSWKERYQQIDLKV